VIFITHNVCYAYAVGIRFNFLNRGHLLGAYAKIEIYIEDLLNLMPAARNCRRSRRISAERSDRRRLILTLGAWRASP